MSNNSVLIHSNPTAHCLTVHFLDKNGGTVKKFQFYNFFGNGDSATGAIAAWINEGVLPNKVKQIKGLVEVQ